MFMNLSEVVATELSTTWPTLFPTKKLDIVVSMNNR
jgi:hypothetical protein